MPAPRILVIRGGAIGDFILTLPAIRLLRENFPAAHLELLGYEHIVALAHGRFYADASRSIEYGPMAGFFVPRSVLDPALAEYFASFQQVVSYLFDPDGFFEMNIRRAGVKNFLAAHTKLHESEHAARQLARPLEGLALFLDDHAATVHLTEADRAFAADFCGEAEGRLIAIHPGSGSPRKNWPTENWIALCESVFARGPSYRIVLVGGEADQMELTSVQAALDRDRLLIARDLSLPQLAAILERCALFVGHDSGISHLAAAAGTRCILLFGPTNPLVWAPANRGVEVLQAPEGNWAELTGETVLERVRQALQATP